ncbi:bifunctional phosphopantothenoylcysteine decarboxylase/phosphopantothenate--cysteine ligase CoaBC [Thermosipho atlanticus]|uniref:Coenzyme A biosynthesis bifunctional protein CoaBC n=1 Tax=Thermosipho atlanticus DSM 15807 TaxID=1123380 RepID=A0A1M5QQW3_9BACT|nr:bifunctional phosphopantothenoylcysteine decarboxylase/phosphopantothenate--cysteine ligase CoaBC [Thermosipho atlanticus]SHH16179.1 Phosphopantothenate-cysteine ligase [Thermosipho atlanticus DSM 15807]
MHILLGVSSGIAIYKTVDLVSKLRKENYDIDIVMTENAAKLVSPTVFSAVGNCNVYINTFDINHGWITHTDLSKKTDIFVLAPATANTIAKIANGLADNLLTTIALALPEKTPKVIVPTMNTRMYENPITQKNLENLNKYGWYILEPDEGHLACGDIGKGRYPDNRKILEVIKFITSPKILMNKKVLVTAGPTRENIDPIRFISNNSSGKMGYSMAKVAKRLGAYTCLISGPTCLEKPHLIDEFIQVTSANEMFNRVMERVTEYDLIIMTAAVADYKPKTVSNSKIKKVNSKLIVELERTKDILSEIGKNKKNNQIVVGFAAETENIIEYGKEKLKKKNADYIVANNANEVMGKDSTKVYVISKDSIKEIEGSKEKVAEEIYKIII